MCYYVNIQFIDNTPFISYVISTKSYLDIIINCYFGSNFFFSVCEVKKKEPIDNWLTNSIVLQSLHRDFYQRFQGKTKYLYLVSALWLFYSVIVYLKQWQKQTVLTTFITDGMKVWCDFHLGKLPKSGQRLKKPTILGHYTLTNLKTNGKLRNILFIKIMLSFGEEWLDIWYQSSPSEPTALQLKVVKSFWKGWRKSRDLLIKVYSLSLWPSVA